MNRMTTAAAAVGVSAVAAHALPAALFWPALRLRVWPALAGVGDDGATWH